MGTLAIATTSLAQAEADEPKEPRGRGLFKDPRTSDFEQYARVASLCLEVHKHVLASLVAAKGDGEALGKIQQSLTQCREFCELTSHILLRNSPFTKEACLACATVCSQCADLGRKAAQG